MANYMETKAEYYRRRAEELEFKAAQLDAFGPNSAYAAESVIFFKRTFGDPGWSKTYIYAAVKVDDYVWFITGKGSTRWSWDRLVNEHLIDADEVWLAREWDALP